ncbi:MAG: TraU family protein [Salinisphaera sp.]|nr:TraU family protein [Salinisphaera sp.]
MSIRYRWARTRLAPLLFLLLSLGLAQNAAAVNASCPDAKIFGVGMVTKVCWDCLFPVVVSGIRLGGTEDAIPDGAADTKPLCLCKDNLGVYQVGIPISMWQPARLVEVVRIPYCSPTLGGVMLQQDLLRIGTPGPANSRENSQRLAFYQYHYFAFPLLVMLDLFLQTGCNAGGFSDMDLMYISELDPSWNDDELAFYLNPESAIFANPVALAACAVDAAAVTAGHPLEKLFWCAGSWGGLYPLVGHVVASSSPPRSTSLIATRALAALHRRGLARKTMGNDAMCRNPIYPTLPKTQYKFQQLYPMPEANSNHWIGAPTFAWGEWRNNPAVGEDFVHLIWRWDDCCGVTD